MGLGLIVGSKIFLRPVGKERPQTIQRLNIHLQEEAPLAPVGVAPLGIGRPAQALAPDGSQLVYVGEHEGETALYLRPLDSMDAQPLPGTGGAYNPFFSPDGQWVGFFSGNHMKKISIAGGQPVTLCESTNAYGATWAVDGKIYFAPTEARRLCRISAEGGPAEVVAVPDESRGIGIFRWPQALPDGKGIFFSNGMLSLATNELIALSDMPDPRYLSTGHVVYSRPGGLMAVSFDLEQHKVTGTPTPVLDGIRTESFGAAQYAISDTGLLVYFPGQSAAVGRLVWVDRQGQVEKLPFRAENFGPLRISPDGTKLAAGILGSENHIWVYDLIGKGEPQRLSTEENESNPTWTPDGSRIAFSAQVDGHRNIFWRPSDRSREREQLTRSDNALTPQSWSPDGQLLSVIETTQGNMDIFILDLKSRELRPFSATRFQEWGSAFSPDGRWIAYTSDESGQYEVYVQPWPPTGGKWQVSTTAGGNEEPVWSRNGRELFYRNGRRWMAVPISTLPGFSSGAPQVLFQGDYINVSGLEYDVSPDGRRFLVLQPVEASGPTELHVVINWFDELKRLVPTGK